ncbi:MAG TPA: adenosylcobinamide amidohydrolase [Methylomirabilota bacterium]|nr:adenosylcobinamide amidohydrolase [Methylomirabilota bacterium]
MIVAGVETTVTPEAVIVTAARDLTVVSSAFAGGGVGRARTLVNLHVAKNFPCADGDATVGAFVRRRNLPSPWIGLLTSAWTEKAESALEAAGGITALVVATVGLSNASAAGVTAASPPTPGTINTIVVVDADVEPAAMVNLVMTVTEVKTALLLEAGVKSPDGIAATGTSTDAVAIAATGVGTRCRFGGPITEVGWVVARAARRALGAGVRRWLEDNR